MHTTRELPKSFWQRMAHALGTEVAELRAQVAKLQGEAEAKPLLSPAEIRVLILVAHGLTNDQIAQRLGVSTPTIRNHTISIFAKLGVNSRTQAARHAWRTGLVTVDEAWQTIAEMQGLR